MEEENVGFLEKMIINRDIKEYQDKIRKLNELNKTLSNLEFISSDNFEIPKSLEDEFQKLGANLSNDERRNLNQLINESLMNKNKDKKERIESESEKAQKLVKDLKLDNSTLIIKNAGIEDSYLGSIYYPSVIKEIKKSKITALKSDTIFLSSRKDEDLSFSSEEIMLEQLEEMKNQKELMQDKDLINIIENLEEIKNSFSKKRQLDSTILSISNTISQLNKVTEVDFSKVRKYLEDIKKNYERELEKVEKFLSQFNFDEIKKQIEIKKEQEEKENLEQSRITYYENLAYELEKVKTENPENLDKIRELQEQMRDFSMKYGFSKDQLETFKKNGEIKYQEDLKKEMAHKEAMKARIDYENQLEKSAMASLREAAIQELESSGAFEGNYEYRNGDVYSSQVDREKLISRKIEELKQMALLTPEERGLRELKRRGIVGKNATIYDLTPSQLNDIKIGYSDGALGLSEYKDYMKREQVKPKANNIYKEYIRYRASLEDKTNFISFSDFAKQKYNLDNISESMVDEELLDEVRGMSK